MTRVDQVSGVQGLGCHQCVVSMSQLYINLCTHANVRASMLKADLQTAGVALSRRYEEQLFTQTSQAKGTRFDCEYQ
jgi:hypothetical protein